MLPASCDRRVPPRWRVGDPPTVGAPAGEGVIGADSAGVFPAGRDGAKVCLCAERCGRAGDRRILNLRWRCTNGVTHAGRCLGERAVEPATDSTIDAQPAGVVWRRGDVPELFSGPDDELGSFAVPACNSPVAAHAAHVSVRRRDSRELPARRIDCSGGVLPAHHRTPGTHAASERVCRCDRGERRCGRAGPFATVKRPAPGGAVEAQAAPVVGTGGDCSEPLAGLGFVAAAIWPPADHGAVVPQATGATSTSGYGAEAFIERRSVLAIVHAPARHGAVGPQAAEVIRARRDRRVAPVRSRTGSLASTTPALQRLIKPHRTCVISSSGHGCELPYWRLQQVQVIASPAHDCSLWAQPATTVRASRHLHEPAAGRAGRSIESAASFLAAPALDVTIQAQTAMVQEPPRHCAESSMGCRLRRGRPACQGAVDAHRAPLQRPCRDRAESPVRREPGPLTTPTPTHDRTVDIQGATVNHPSGDRDELAGRSVGLPIGICPPALDGVVVAQSARVPRPRGDRREGSCGRVSLPVSVRAPAINRAVRAHCAGVR